MSLKNKIFVNLLILLAFLSFLVLSLSFVYAKDFIIQNATTGNYLFVVNGTTGYVGIGLVNPAYPLHVVGNAYFANDIICSGCIHSSDIANSAVGLNQLASISCSEGSAIRVLGNGQLVCVQINATQGVINGSGIVNYIPVFTGVSTIGASPFYLTSTNLNLGQQSLINASWVNASYLNISAGFVVLPTGNVGIGTISPAYKLDVAGDIRATSAVYSTNGYYIGSYLIIDSSRNLVGINQVSQNLNFGSSYSIYNASWVNGTNAYFSGTIYGNIQGTITPTGDINMNNKNIYNANWVNATNLNASNTVYATVIRGATIYQGSNQVIDTINTNAPISISGSGNSRTIGLNYDTSSFTLSGSNLALSNTGVTAGTYGSASQVAQFTVNAQGRITSATNVNIAIDASQITSGTISGDRLDSNVAWLNRSQTWTAAQTFNENVWFNKNVFIAGNLSYVNVQTLNVNGSMIPIFDNQFNLGNSSNRWANVYAVNVYANNINGGSPITGSGNTNYVAKFTGINTLGNSIIYDTGTNVGIGTINPQDKLHVSGGKIRVDNSADFELYFAGAQSANIYQSDTSYPLYINTAGGPIYLGTGASGATHLNIVGGNVGIGTTNPSEKLHVYSGGIRLENYNPSPTSNIGYLLIGGANPNSTIFAFPRISGSNDNAFLYAYQTSTNDYDLRLYLQDDQDDSEKFSIWGGSCSNGGCAQDTTNAALQHYFTAAGNAYHRNNLYVGGSVGIGTTSPTQRLTVTGNIGIQAGVNAFIGTLDNYALSLRTNNVDRIFITNTGNVGIGTTSPLSTLHIYSTAGALNITNTTTGASIFLVDALTGNVGIGTTAPNQKLRVVGGNIWLSGNYELGWDWINTDRASIRFESTGDASGASKLILETLDNGDEPIEFRQSGNVRMVISNIGPGYVGIGTTSPSSKLEVYGGDIEINDGFATGSYKIKGLRVFYAGDETQVSTTSTTYELKKQFTSVFDSQYGIKPNYVNIIARIWNGAAGSTTYLNVTFEGCNGITLSATSTTPTVVKTYVYVGNCVDSQYPTKIYLSTTSGGTAYNDLIEFYYVE